MEATQILAMTKPGQLFPDRVRIKEIYRELVKIWHPDRNGGDTAVFQKINELHSKIDENAEFWETDTSIEIAGKKLHFVAAHGCEIGRIYVARNYIGYLINNSNQDLIDNDARMRGMNFKFPDDEMKTYLTKWLPVLKSTVKTDNYTFIVFEKNSQTILLYDLMKHINKIDPKHAAWMTSRLINWSCFFEYNGFSHNAIGPLTCLVDPASHSIAMYGWWYARPLGSKLIAIPERTAFQSVSDIMKNPIASPKIDLELSRSMCRELMGNILGSKLISDKSLPQAMVSWSRLPSPDSAIKDHNNWNQKILPESFGPRKFVEMNVSFDDVYKK